MLPFPDRATTPTICGALAAVATDGPASRATETAWWASCSGVMSRRLRSVMPMPVTATASGALMGTARSSASASRGDLDGGPAGTGSECGAQRLEVLQRVLGGHHDDDVLRSGSPEGVDGLRTVVGRSGDDVPLEGAWRNAVEGGEPFGAVGGHRLRRADPGEEDDGPNYVLGRSPGGRRGGVQAVEPGLILLGGEEQGDPAVAHGGRPPQDCRR